MTTPRSESLHWVVAPDSFKGSASASEVAHAIAQGIRNALPRATVTELPFADGGEGTLDALLQTGSMTEHTVATSDALGRPITARLGIASDSSLAIIECAEANGLPGVSDAPLRPLDATSYGVGALVRAALDAGCSELILCLGGSATTDGGAGMLSALGAKFLDRDGAELAPGGGALSSLDRIDLNGLDPRVFSTRWRFACDVTNPLVGERGAAAVFGPQKGANPEQVETLDRGLSVFSRLLEAHSTRDQALDREPGLGAAGGLALGPFALFNASLEPGSELVAETLGLQERVENADVVITGEGRFDEQSLHGKVVDAIRRYTPAETPVIVFAGSITLDDAALRRHGITAAFATARGPAQLADLQETVLHDLQALGGDVARLLNAGAAFRSP
ncbi:glycerate kinase [Humidisolicoccus flavus]|uniref:glycerate kinase n=1 Tax=Humidisolicoccus flavus TaxID=3111414 RepID=UPI00324DF1F5